MRKACRIDIRRAAHRPWVPGDRQLRAWVGTALTQAPRPPRTPTTRGAATIGRRPVVSVHIVGERAGRTLNARYRGKDRATNVLSFPGPGALPDGEHLLGDIVICAPVMAREAREQGKTPAAHWAHITVHGTLHLLGFDHLRACEAQVMEALEVRVLHLLGIGDPYVRTPAPAPDRTSSDRCSR